MRQLSPSPVLTALSRETTRKDRQYGYGHVACPLAHDRRFLITALALPGILSAPESAQNQVATSYPMEVTTDTPEYCLYLLDRVSDLVRVAAPRCRTT